MGYGPRFAEPQHNRLCSKLALRVVGLGALLGLEEHKRRRTRRNPTQHLLRLRQI